MKIVFITPATALRRFPPYRLGGKLYGQPNSITGPLILGGICRRAGHDVSVYEELNGSVPYKKLWDADVFCISIMTCNAKRGYEIADMVHENAPKARVIMGGFHASSMPEEAIQHADQVIAGEGENVILDCVEGRIRDRIVHVQPIEDLDTCPFPDYSILKTPVKAANVITSRGCPFRCAFCSTSRMLAPYRKRSIDNVIEEIRMYKQMGFRYMNFEDDNFTADRERAKEICRRMIAEGLTFKETFFFGRTDLAQDDEMLTLLHDAHLTRVLIGIESLNQKALDAIDKHQSIDNIKAAAAACKRHGIRVIASIVLGIDEDSVEDMDRSIQFARDIDAYQLQPAVLTPLPGTPVYEQFMKEDRMLYRDWEEHDFMNVTFRPKNCTPWQLQDEFYHASTAFYNYRSAFRIGKLFGAEYGWRRFGFAIFAHLGPWGARFCSLHVPVSFYYKLRHEQYDLIGKKTAEKVKEPVNNNLGGNSNERISNNQKNGTGANVPLRL
jgi:radical SAM superfamily enzyme YgiQ (UPF0313 family)